MMLIPLIRAWFFPPEAARQEIMVKCGHLAQMGVYTVKNFLAQVRLPVHVPVCRSYTVEYRLSETGEFAVSRDENGNLGVRSDLDPRRRFPVCWLPPSFAGKRVDRYILLVDRRQVSYRAGVRCRRAA